MQPDIYVQYVHVFSMYPFHHHRHLHTQTNARSWSLIGWAIRNTITDSCVKKEKVNSTKYAFLGRRTPKWAWIFKKLCMHTRYSFKLTQGNTLPSIMQTNIFIALFGGWHDLWEKLPISSISVAIYQGTVKGADCRGEEKETWQPGT